MLESLHCWTLWLGKRWITFDVLKTQIDWTFQFIRHFVCLNIFGSSSIFYVGNRIRQILLILFYFNLGCECIPNSRAYEAFPDNLLDKNSEIVWQSRASFSFTDTKIYAGVNNYHIGTLKEYF